MTKREKQKQAAKYKYVCKTCNCTKHTLLPANEPCPVCGKRMELIGFPKPEPIKYPEEIKAESQARILKLSEYGKLSTLKSILNTPDEAA